MAIYFACIRYNPYSNYVKGTKNFIKMYIPVLVKGVNTNGFFLNVSKGILMKSTGLNYKIK